MVQELQTEGIVLSSISFKESDRLVTLLTQDFGLLKFYMRGVNRPKNKYFALKEPLSHFECVFREKRGDFHLFLEGKLLHSFMDIRSSYPHLMSSFELIRCLLKTLMPAVAHPEIYLLFKKYLMQLKNFKDPTILVSSFYLKLLLFEGLLNLKTTCSSCQEASPFLYVQEKDYFCKKCTNQIGLFFSQEEIRKIFELVKIKSFGAYQKQLIKSELSQKIKKLYSALLEIVF